MKRRSVLASLWTSRSRLISACSSFSCFNTFFSLSIRLDIMSMAPLLSSFSFLMRSHSSSACAFSCMAFSLSWSRVAWCWALSSSSCMYCSTMRVVKRKNESSLWWSPWRAPDGVDEGERSPCDRTSASESLLSTELSRCLCDDGFCLEALDDWSISLVATDVFPPPSSSSSSSTSSVSPRRFPSSTSVSTTLGDGLV